MVNISPDLGVQLDLTNLRNLGVPIIELSHEIIGKDAFYDSHHMICSGALRNSKYLADELSEYCKNIEK